MMRRIFTLVYAVFAITIAFFPVFVRAGTVGNFTDQPSTTQVSVGSNHKFTFTVTSAVSEGSTISITFPSGFDLSALGENDVDIADDGVDLPTSSDCSGSDQVSVGFSGQIVLFTICSGDGGTIAISSVVTIEIGTNAASSGFGTHRIINPSAIASYFINLSETGGNSGSIIFTTTTTGSSAVTATVPDPGGAGDGGGGGGGGGDPDPECVVDVDLPCTSPENSCGMTEGGIVSCDGSCSAVAPSNDFCSACDALVGEGCHSSENACGMTNNGTIQCDGSCDAVAPNNDECPATCDGETGNSCISSANSCGETNGGVIECDGSCSAIAPSESSCPATCVVAVGSACTSSENSCGETNVGTVQCDGSCTASTPSESSCANNFCVDNAGQVCVTSPNSCGMTNSGIIACRGECSAEAPSEDLCASALSCADTQGERCASDANVCGIVNYGIIACSGLCSAEIPSEQLCVSPTLPKDPDEVAGSTDPVVPGEYPPANIAVLPVSLEVIRSLPEVQIAVTVATSIAVAAAVSTVAVLATSFNLLPYLQFLFTSPLQFISRRKRKAFGVVYNSGTKVAVDLAIVRLYNASNNRLVKSMVTDAEGKYFFVADPGQYRVTVSKNGLLFPSTDLAGVKDDGTFLDVYTGQIIDVTQRDAIIAANIPLDIPQGQKTQEPKHIARRRLLRKMQFVVSLSGSLLSVCVFVVSPSLLTLSLAIGQIMIFIIFRRLALQKKPKGWGVVYDAITRRPVGNAVVRLFEPKYNKLVETTLTDALGRYSFLVGPNEYFVSTNRDGYDEQIIRQIDYRQRRAPEPLAIDVPLAPKQS